MSRVYAPYYKLKKQDFVCSSCGWKGKGSELDVSEVFEASAVIEYVCPKCSEDIAFTAGPTLAESVAHWEEVDKADRYVVLLALQNWAQELGAKAGSKATNQSE